MLKQSKLIKPDFLIIGAPKCGTSSLYAYLLQHPRIATAVRKEISFFSRLWDLGPAWYSAHFDAPTADTITGEASTTYLFTPISIGRIKTFVPDVKLIALLRNPAERTISHYHHNVRAKREPLPLDEALEQEEKRIAQAKEAVMHRFKCWHPALPGHAYVQRSIYADQLSLWYDAFPFDQILVLQSERLFGRPNETTNRVFEFLGLPTLANLDTTPANMGAYNNRYPETYGRLQAYFTQSNERLYSLTGRRFDWE